MKRKRILIGVLILIAINLWFVGRSSQNETINVSAVNAKACADRDKCYTWCVYQQGAMVLQCGTAERGCCYIDNFYGENSDGTCVRIAYPDCNQIK